MSVDAFPLQWPVGWIRTSSNKREHSRFVTTFSKARDELINEVRRLGGRMVVVSTDIPLRNDGLPYALKGNPSDPGVAVYFEYGKKQMVFACDKYVKIHENVRAISKTIEAIRGIERWGASDMMERAFTGFQALPAPETQDWWDILQVRKDSSEEEIRSNFRRLAKEHHPDKGGSLEKMENLNAAYKSALSEVSR